MAGTFLLFLAVAINVNSQQVPQNPFATYHFYVNITNVNWHINPWGNNVSQSAQASAVAVGILSNGGTQGNGGIPSSSTYYVIADQHGFPIIPFTVITNSSGGAFLLLSNKTLNGTTWASATVFYNISSGGQVIAFPPKKVLLTATNTLFNYIPYYSGNITLFGVQGNVVDQVNKLAVFELNHSASYFVVSNQSMLGTNFNVTIYSTPYYKVYTTSKNSTRYALNTYSGCVFLLCGTRVTTSYEAPSTYTGMLGGNFFEYTQLNISTMLDHAYTFGNTSVNYGLFVQYSPNIFSWSIWMQSIPSNTNIWVLPAFTTSYTITKQYNVTTAPISGLSKCNFIAVQNFTNANFSYNYYSPVLGIPSIGNTLTFTSSKVWWLKVTMPHYNPGLGNACQNAYFTTQNQGSIPYAVLTCNATTAVYLLRNSTNQSFAYNSFSMYANWPGLTFNLSNQSLLNNYFINKNEQFNVFNINASKRTYPLLPFVINLTSSVDATSKFYLYAGNTIVQFTKLQYNFTQQAVQLNGNWSVFTGSVTDHVQDWRFNVPDRNFLYTNQSSIYNVITQSMQLEIFANYPSSPVTCGAIWRNLTSTASQLFHNNGCNMNLNPNILTGVMFGDIRGRSTYLASSLYSNTPFYSNPFYLNQSACSTINPSGSGALVVVSNTPNSNSLITSNNLILPSNTIQGNIKIAPDVIIPIYLWILMMFVMVIFEIAMSNSMLSAVVPAFLWLLSFFNIQEVPMAIICTLMFAYFYINNKN